MTVALRPGAAGDQVELSVRDTGVGIPPTELPRLFERFHRVEGQAGRTQEGTGIGLALVQELVRLHGGTVTVESAPGQGSTFTVAIPSGSAHLPAERIGGAADAAATEIRAEAYVEEALRWLEPRPAPSRSLKPSPIGARRRRRSRPRGAPVGSARRRQRRYARLCAPAAGRAL